MKRLARIVVLMTIPVAGSACGSSHRGSSSTSHPQGSAVSAKSARSSRLILGGRVRCTATVATPVRVGDVLQVGFSVRNVSQRPVKVQLARDNLWFVVRGADGTTYDTRQRDAGSLGGPFIEPTTIRAGGTETRPLSYVRASWSGPLRITPGCEQTPLPPVRVGVAAAGRPLSPGIAVAEVVAASGHLTIPSRSTPPRQPTGWHRTGTGPVQTGKGRGDPAAVAGVAAAAARQARWSSSSRSARPEQSRIAPLSGSPAPSRAAPR